MKWNVRLVDLQQPKELWWITVLRSNLLPKSDIYLAFLLQSLQTVTNRLLYSFMVGFFFKRVQLSSDAGQCCILLECATMHEDESNLQAMAQQNISSNTHTHSKIPPIKICAQNNYILQNHVLKAYKIILHACPCTNIPTDSYSFASGNGRKHKCPQSQYQNEHTHLFVIIIVVFSKCNLTGRLLPFFAR